MFNLIKNEWMKLWAKKATWVMFILILLAFFTMFFLIRFVPSIVGGPINTEVFIEYISTLLSLVSLFGIIVAAGIVSFEFGTGTIKMLLTRPIARWKILLSKLLTTLIFTLLLAIILFVLSLIFGYIFFDLPLSSETNLFLEALKNYSLQFGDIIISILFAFMLSTLFNSSSLAIGLTLFIMFTSSIFVAIFSKYAFIKYLWFSISDLKGISQNMSVIEDLTLGFAIPVLAVYAVIFIAISFFVFHKKDITA